MRTSPPLTQAAVGIARRADEDASDVSKDIRRKAAERSACAGPTRPRGDPYRPPGYGRMLIGEGLQRGGRPSSGDLRVRPTSETGAGAGEASRSMTPEVAA